MFARTEQHNHFAVTFYDVAGIGTLQLSTAADGTWPSGPDFEASFDHTMQSLREQGYGFSPVQPQDFFVKPHSIKIWLIERLYEPKQDPISKALAEEPIPFPQVAEVVV